MDGGITGPIVDDAAATAAAKLRSNPASSIALISILPRPIASASAAPDTPAKIIDASTATWASPPRTWPTTARANVKIRAVMPPVFIRLPARMKNGIASSVNDVDAEYIRCAIAPSICVSPKPMKNPSAVKPIAMAMGRPARIKSTRTAKIENTSTANASRAAGHFFRASSTYFWKVLTLSSPA